MYIVCTISYLELSFFRFEFVWVFLSFLSDENKFCGLRAQASNNLQNYNTKRVLKISDLNLLEYTSHAIHRIFARFAHNIQQFRNSNDLHIRRFNSSISRNKSDIFIFQIAKTLLATLATLHPIVNPLKNWIVCYTFCSIDA